MSLERLLDLTPHPPAPENLYVQLDLPAPPEDRPYLYINMVSTADGKIVIGKAGGPAKGVGGPTDQLLFRRLQQNCDAAMIGSTTLRASQVIYPAHIARFVVTRSGDVPLKNRFFTDAPERVYVLAPEDLPHEKLAILRAYTNVVQAGLGSVDLVAAMRLLRQEFHIRYLLCEGGGNLNDELIRAGLADEMFLTLAPKVKGGSGLPTPVGGQGFPPGQFLPLTLLSLYRDGDEIYLRYSLQTAS